MDKVRFACPRCQTIMQTAAEKVGHEVACPHCEHRFGLVEPERAAESPAKTDPVDGAGDGLDSGLEETFDRGVEKVAVPSPAIGPGAAKVLQRVTPTQPFRQVGFQCPYCQTTRAPISKSEVSQLGWLVFIVMLVMTCFGCIIGLFIRDRYTECSQCKIRLG